MKFKFKIGLSFFFTRSTRSCHWSTAGTANGVLRASQTHKRETSNTRRQKTEPCWDRYPAMDRTVGWHRRCRGGGAIHLADMNDCSQRLGFHAAAIFAQARAAGTGRPFDIHLTSKCLLSRSLLSSLLVSPPSVTRPFILRHDFWPERFCCSTYLPFFFSLPPPHIREMRCLLFITKKEREA